MKYTLTCTDGNFTNTVEFEQDFLPSVLENMQLFLRGCGFYFDGTLDIINEETEELYSDTHDYLYEQGYAHIKDNELGGIEHSQHYFDTTRNR
jgi:hypothetical protein